MAKALMIIDMLKGYMSDTNNPKELIKNQIKLCSAFKKKGYKIILAIPDFKNTVKNPVLISLWGEEFKDDPEGRKIVKELSNIKFDKIIYKKEYSAFYDTELEKYCKKNKITELYLTGVFSGACVFFTGVDAVYRHIQPYYVEDAVGGSRDDLVSATWNKHTKDMFKMMMGPLIKTLTLIKKL